ncbi:UNVERIFIED_CONTAM: hypothetical protein Sradi_5686700 [Sesamum radiatum]|uniref:Uncharacterized protein n=1 Tax=Sesamum radiatum TaxID=300843 RepID=A0AAW2L234_SESRA
MAAMTEKYDILERNFKDLHHDLKTANSCLEEIQQLRKSENLHFKDLERKMLEEIAQLKIQMEEKDGQVAMVLVENEVLKSLAVQAYRKGGEEGITSGFAMYRNTQEFNDEVCRRGSFFYIDGFAVI